MWKKLHLGSIIATALVAASGCTVHQSSAPSLTGPSELALALNVTASSDSIPLDGSQAVITVTTHDDKGAGAANVQVRLDILVGNTAQDCGDLRPRTVSTNKD